MTPEDFRAVTDVLPEAYMLVSSTGDVLAANRAAAALFRLPSPEADAEQAVLPSRVSLASLVCDAPERVRDYVRAWSCSRSLLPGALTIAGADGGQAIRHRCEGAILRPSTPDETGRILLRVRRDEPVVGRFAVLTKQVGDLTREVRLRRQVEAERTALLAEALRTRETLERQATQLERQRRDAQSLAEELERANTELACALEEAERAREAAERANRVKAEFLAIMSHELRTPLNAIGGYANLLALGVRGPLSAEQLADVERIDRNQRDLLGLINDVLNFAKLDAGRVSFDVRDVAAAELVDGIEALIGPKLREKQIRYAHALDGEELIARADPERVRQVLGNLLSNAVKFTPVGGEIAVVCEADGASIAIHVRDSGIGIPADKCEAIFEPFVQLGRDFRSGGEGTGLGLAISRDLARGMDGDLTVASSEGEGATFTLTLPRSEFATPPRGGDETGSPVA